jgi:hypothetical protein
MPPALSNQAGNLSRIAERSLCKKGHIGKTALPLSGRYLTIRKPSKSSSSGPPHGFGLPISPAANNHHFGRVIFSQLFARETKYGGRN